MQKYAEAAAFFRENGHLNVSKRYRTENNLALGNWIQPQRAVRRGTRAGELTHQQIAKLDSIGMLCQMGAEAGWENGYAHARASREAHGHLDVSVRYVCEDGYKLGGWLAEARNRQDDMPEGKKRHLTELGMEWQPATQWECSFA